MTFFEHQDQARQMTRKLVGLYGLAIACIILSIYMALLVTSWAMGFNRATKQINRYLHPTAIPEPIPTQPNYQVRRNSRLFGQRGYTPNRPAPSPLPQASPTNQLALNEETLGWWQPHLFWLATIPTLLVIGGTSFVKLQALKQGGALVAQELGGRLLLPETATTPAEHQLINVVEEMAIAATIPTPFVYILDNELGINAFAAGYSPKDAVIGVTRGCLQQLDRDELQGVIGHEFSHILNGDMRLNVQLIGALHGIVFIYIFGRVLSYVRGSNRDNNAIMYLGFALMPIGIIGQFFGRLIQSAVSRQREFLADASAVQFTRNPDGLAGALSKIQDNVYRSYVTSPQAEAMGHLFFGTALQSDWFATHPPLAQRIQRLTTYWQRNAKRFAATPSPLSSGAGQSAIGSQSLVMGLAGSVDSGTATNTAIGKGTAQPVPPAWLAQVPASLRQIEDEAVAVAVLYALLLDGQNPQVRTLQENGLRKVAPDVVETTLQLAPDVAALEPKLRLPLADRLLPLVRQVGGDRSQHILKTLQALAKADGQWSIFEFALYTLAWERLQPASSQDTTAATSANPEHVWQDCLVVMAAIAHAGTNKPADVAYAFRSGAYKLPTASQDTIPETPPPCQLVGLKQSLDRLKTADQKLKRDLMDACSYTVMLDSLVTASEVNLMWAISLNLNCPLPPFVLPKGGK